MAFEKLVALAVAATLASAACLASAPAAAPTVAQYEAAGHRLNAEFDAAERAGELPPGPDDPALRTLFDEAAVPVLAREPFPQISESCGASFTVWQRYATWRTPSDAALSGAVVMGRNQLIYQNELSPGMRFMVACMDMATQAALKFWQTMPASNRTPVRRAGIAQLRHALGQIYQGALTMQAGGLSLANRTLVLDALVAHGTSIAAALDLEARKGVLASIAFAMTNSRPPPDLRAKLRALQVAMSRTDCTGFCAI